MNFDSLYRFDAQGYEAYNTMAFYVGLLGLIGIILIGISMVIYVKSKKESVRFPIFVIGFYACVAVLVSLGVGLIVQIYHHQFQKDSHLEIIYEWIDQEYKPVFDQQEPYKDYDFKYKSENENIIILSNGEEVRRGYMEAIVYDAPIAKEYMSYRLPLQIDWPTELDQETVDLIEQRLEYWNWSIRNNKFILHDSE